MAKPGRLDQLTPERLDPPVNGLNRAVGRAENTASEIIRESGGSFGNVFALHELWRDLGIDTALTRALRSSRREIDAGASPLSLGSMPQQWQLHRVHPGNVAGTKTLQAMLATALVRFSILRVVPVADRGLLSLGIVDELTALAARGDRQREFILAETSFAGHRLIVAHDPCRAWEQTTRRRARIAELEAMGEKMVAKLDAQDEGQSARGRRAHGRGACSRFTRADTEAGMTRFIRPDLQADRFSWSVDEAAVAEAQLFDGRLALTTNAPDLTPSDAVARHKALADIERGFRVLKSDIQTAPVHHHLPDGICAHALTGFLALVLWRFMYMRPKARAVAPPAPVKRSTFSRAFRSTLPVSARAASTAPAQPPRSNSISSKR